MQKDNADLQSGTTSPSYLLFASIPVPMVGVQLKSYTTLAFVGRRKVLPGIAPCHHIRETFCKRRTQTEKSTDKCFLNHVLSDVPLSFELHSFFEDHGILGGWYYKGRGAFLFFKNWIIFYVMF